MDSLAPARNGFWMKWFHTFTLETRCKSSWDLDFLCRGETTKEGESSILIKSDVRSKPLKKVKHQMMSDQRNWRRWNTRKNKCTHESLAVELLVCLLAIRTSRRINDTFCPRVGESGESALPGWILSTVPGTNLLPFTVAGWLNEYHTVEWDTLCSFFFPDICRFTMMYLLFRLRTSKHMLSVAHTVLRSLKVTCQSAAWGKLQTWYFCENSELFSKSSMQPSWE